MITSNPLKILTITAAAIFLTSGCQPEKTTETAKPIELQKPVPITETSYHNLQLIHTEDVRLIKIKIIPFSDTILINGRVKRMPSVCCDRITGHIDIAVLAADQFLIDDFSTYFKPRYIPKRRTKSSSFKISLPASIPEGSIIRLAYHETIDLPEYDGKLKCQQNIAIPNKTANSD